MIQEIRRSSGPRKSLTALKIFVTKRGLSAGVTLGSCIVLEIVGEGGLSMLYDVMESGTSEPFTSSSSNEQVIRVHFGVNSGSQKFSIERQAVNEASFGSSHNNPRRRRNFPEKTDDAGRFVCNYVYYQYSTTNSDLLNRKHLIVRTVSQPNNV